MILQLLASWNLRAKSDNPVGKTVVSGQSEDQAGFRHKLYTFSLSNFEQVAREYHDPKILGELNSRAAELWRPLLAIAKVVDADSKLGLYDLIYQHALEYMAEASVAKIDDECAAMIQALVTLTADGTEEFQLKVLNQMLSGSGDDLSKSPFNPQWVGYRLKHFGFKSRRKKSGTVYLCAH